MTLVAAILLGLRQRDRTGKGNWVGTSLYANGAWTNGTILAGTAIGAEIVPREPPDRPRNALTNLYRTSDDRWLQLLLVRDDRLFGTFCKATGLDALASDPRYADREERKRRAQELHAVIAPVFASKTYAEWAGILAPTGIPFGVIERVGDVAGDEQARHAGIFAETDNPDVPRTVNNPIRLGFAEPRRSGVPASVGQHSEEILREQGYGSDEIAALRKAGVLGEPG
jgi:crotonobetainyl-CoA:carnitine CoA-transferase CaiB-like acyl-CoA transferase